MCCIVSLKILVLQCVIFTTWFALGKVSYSKVPGTVGSDSVRLEVTDYSGVNRIDWPVTSGIPLPKGAVKDEQNIALFNSEGREILLQTSVLSRYWESDSSIRWVLLDFRANVPTHGTSYYTVKYGDEIHRHQFPTELKVKKEGNEVSINTGVLKFKVGQDFLSDVQMKTKEGWKKISSSEGGNMTMEIGSPPDTTLPVVVLGKGRNEGHYSTRLDRDVKVEVEDAGLLRAQIKVSGWHVREDGRRFGPFTLRVNAYAGKSYLQVYHTFINSDLPERGLIENVGIHMPLEMKGEKEITFGSEPLERVKGNEGEYYLLQDKWNGYKIQSGGKEKGYNGQCGGWMDVSNGRLGVTAMFRNCAQMFPKEIKYQNNELSVWCYPEDGVGPLDLRREEQKNLPGWEEFKKDYPAAYERWDARKEAGYKKALRDGNLYDLLNHSALGFSRTHEMYFFFHDSRLTENKIAQWAEANEKPLMAFALNHWYDYTDALGHFGWKDTVDFPLVENYFTKKN